MNGFGIGFGPAPRRAACVLFALQLLASCAVDGGDSAVGDPSDEQAPDERGLAAGMSVAAVTASEFPVKVFFSKNPDSLARPRAVFPVNRISPTVSVGTFALQLLIAGPTPAERRAGYFSEVNGIFTGPSTCSAPVPGGGPDFRLRLDRRGSTVEPGTATVRFCRASSSAGIGTDARVSAQISATLKQFSSIQRVVILTSNGHCFGDESGQDRCLNP